MKLNSQKNLLGTHRNDTFTNSCKSCKSISLLYDDFRGEIICGNCGLVISSPIFDKGPEWRAFDAEGHKLKARSSYPACFLSNRETQTIIERDITDTYGNILNRDIRVKYTRLSQKHDHITDNISRNLRNAVLELKRIKSHLNLSDDVCLMAIYLYKLAQSKLMIKGRSVIGMISAAIYLACRKKGRAIVIKDIANVANITTKELGKCIRVFLWNIKIDKTKTDPVSLIHRLSENLNLTMYTRKVAMAVLAEAHEKQITIGKTPMSLAAAALYIASVKTGERRTQK